MDFELGTLQECKDGISSMNGLLEKNYDSSWSDSVHDSFGSFVDAFNGQIKELDSLMSQLKKLCDSLESINVDELSESCDALISEIN